MPLEAGAHSNGIVQGQLRRTPLEYSGSLDSYESVDLTAVIGREFPKLQLSEIVEDDTKIRDLAILCSLRGVVFLRNQDISPEKLKILTHKLGVLTGKPKESTVCRAVSYFLHDSIVLRRSDKHTSSKSYTGML